MRERRRYLLILGAILALLVGAGLLAVPGSPAYKKPTLGLDLRGGLEVVLKALPPHGQSVTPQNMQTAQNIMVRRVNKIGVSSPNVATQGTDEIVIQLAGIHDPAKAAAIIGSTGQLQFYDFEKDLAAPTVNQLKPTPYPTAYSLLKQIQGQVKKAGVPSQYYLTAPMNDYAHYFHTISIGGRSYAFSYDDVNDQSSVRILGNTNPPSQLTIASRKTFADRGNVCMLESSRRSNFTNGFSKKTT